MNKDIDHLSPVWTHLTGIQPVRGEGIYLYDNDGKRYMDFTSGIGVINTGHCHPAVVDAICAQSKDLIFGQINTVISPAVIEVSRSLDRITPPSINNFFFSNSGAEAVEASVKLARAVTSRKNIIVFQGSFHGRTHQTMAMTTSKYIYRYNYQPLPGGIFVAPYPCSYYFGWDEQETVDFCLQQLDLIFHSQTAPEETAAVIIEPVLGEGGYVPAPVEYLRALRQITAEYGILLILDEVQSGFGRTGRFFCFEHADIVPDIVVMGKGLASGMPMSAVGANLQLMENWIPGSHGGTYGGGNAVVAAAASATIDTIEKEGLLDNTKQMGEYLLEELSGLKSRYPIIGDVRGRGLMIGVEFSNNAGKPAPEFAESIQKQCLERKLLLLTCGSYKNVIRWIPPLVVKLKELDQALEIFESALRTC